MKLQWSRFLLLGCALALVSSSGVNAGNAKKKKKDNFQVKEYGVTKGKEINSGFFFYNGHYVDAPYRVSRKGLGIFINGRLVYWSVPARPAEEPLRKDPGLPKGLKKSAGFDDVREHRWRKLKYLFDNYSDAEARKRYIQYLRKLPPVRLVKRLSETDIEVVLFNGSKRRVGVEWYDLEELTKDDVLSSLRRDRQRYEDHLIKHRAILFFLKPSHEMLLWPEDVVIKLPVLIKSMRSKKNEREKMADLIKLGLYEMLPRMNMDHVFDVFGAGRALRPLFNDFQASKQLDERLRAFVKTGYREYLRQKRSQEKREAAASERRAAASRRREAQKAKEAKARFHNGLIKACEERRVPIIKGYSLLLHCRETELLPYEPLRAYAVLVSRSDENNLRFPRPFPYCHIWIASKSAKKLSKVPIEAPIVSRKRLTVAPAKLNISAKGHFGFWAMLTTDPLTDKSLFEAVDTYELQLRFAVPRLETLVSNKVLIKVRKPKTASEIKGMKLLTDKQIREHFYSFTGTQGIRDLLKLARLNPPTRYNQHAADLLGRYHNHNDLRELGCAFDAAKLMRLWKYRAGDTWIQYLAGAKQADEDFW